MAKIILCDDSKAALTFFERNLQKNGHEVIGKGQDGNEGYKLYIENKPDIVLLDITMPNRDGKDCLTDILKLDPLAKVIMISALKDEELVKDCLTVGAKGFISKSDIYTDDKFKDNVLSLIDKTLHS